MIEDIIDSLRTILQTNLPAKLDLIEAARPGITLPDPAEIRVASSPTEETHRFPYIVLSSGGSSVDKLPGQTQLFKHRILIEVYHRDHDEERRERILWRYQEAINKVWRDDLTLGGKAQTSNPAGVDYSYLVDVDKEEVWAKGIAITLEATEKI